MNLLRKGIVVSAGQVAGIVLTAVTGIIYSRTMGPSGTGQFELFRSTQTLAATFAAMGIGSACIYLLNNCKLNPALVVTSAVKTCVVLGLLLWAGLATGVMVSPGYFGRVSAASAAGFAAGSACLLSTALLRPVLVAQMAAKRMVLVDLTPRVTMLLVGGALALSGHLRLEPALTALMLGNICGCVLLMAFLRDHIRLSLPFDWGLLGALVSYGVKLAAANILYVLSSTITVMLLRCLLRGGFEAVGLYTRAVAVSSMVTVVPAAVGPLLYARWAEQRGRERARQGEMAARMNLAMGTAACIALMMGGRVIIRAMYGEAFVGATAALQLLAPSLVFVTVFSVCNNMLAGDGRALLTACILAGTVCVIGAVTWLTVPIMGIRGAAMAVLLGNAFTATMGFAVCARLYGIRLHRSLLLEPSDIRYARDALWRHRSQAVPTCVEEGATDG